MSYAIDDKPISRWIAATMPGYVAGGLVWSILFILTRDVRTRDDLLSWVVPLTSISVTGLITGITQGICLRKQDTRIAAKTWAVATLIGMVIGLYVVGLLGFGTFAINFATSGATFAPPFNSGVVLNGPTVRAAIMFLYFGAIFGFVCAAADGLVVGIVQSLVMRSYVREAYWWALINMLATGLAGAVVVVVSWLVGFAGGGLEAVQQSVLKILAIGLVVWSAMGFTVGAASAPLLDWLLRQPIEEGRLF